MSSTPENKPQFFEKIPPHDGQLLFDTEDTNIGQAFGPASSPTPEDFTIRRPTLDRIRAVTGKSIESYIGKYRYYIGQSKYYNKTKPDDEVIFGKLLLFVCIHMYNYAFLYAQK